MLKPVMQKNLILITLLLSCLLISRPVEARLTLGVVVGSNEAASEITSSQANSLATILAEKLQEEVVVRELSDSATLINWLDRFAMLDLALLPVREVQASLTGFVQTGPVDKQEKFTLVFRQGVDRDLPPRVASIVSDPGFSPWRMDTTIAPPVAQGDRKKLSHCRAEDTLCG